MKIHHVFQYSIKTFHILQPFSNHTSRKSSVWGISERFSYTPPTSIHSESDQVRQFIRYTAFRSWGAVAPYGKTKEEIADRASTLFYLLFVFV